ncbi:hypothetical protein Hanom_Chr16g01435471 [Helianthus anomalus]
MHQPETQPYRPFTGVRIRPKVGIDNLITLAAGLNEEQRQTVNEIGFGSIFGSKVTCVPTALANWLVSNYDPYTGVLFDVLAFWQNCEYGIICLCKA